MSKVLRFDADGSGVWVDKSAADIPRRANEPDIVSDSLGTTKWQLDEVREDARRNGFRIEFVEDKGPSGVEGFYPAKGSPTEMARYEKYRQGSEAEIRGAGSGGVVSADALATAARLMREKYPVKEGV
jgi:hypothetical protein